MGFLTYDRCKEKGGGRSLYGLTGDERTRVGFLIYDRCQERGGGGDVCLWGAGGEIAQQPFCTSLSCARLMCDL